MLKPKRTGRVGAIIKAHGLEHVKLTAYDMIKFKRMMEKPGDFQDDPPDIHAEWLALKNINGEQRPA